MSEDHSSVANSSRDAESAREPAKYSAEWVKAKVDSMGARWLTNHDCSLCGVAVGHVFYDDDAVFYRSACGCSSSPDRPSSYAEIAESLAMQSSDKIRDSMMAGLSKTIGGF